MDTLCSWFNHCGHSHGQEVKEVNMADIMKQWLKKEPCGDAISRQAVLDLLFNSYIKTELTSIGYANKEYAELCVDELNELPSVDPQKPKTGCWEYGYTFADGKYGKCSECKKLIKCIYPMHYCPNCGAKMESEG
jgi:hypothetical protein